jgi:surface antigen
VALLALFLGACGSVSMPMGSADVETPLDLTGSIDGQQNTADVDINKQDRAIIASAIGKARKQETADAPFSWTNPITGNSGTILSLVDDSVPGGTGCTRFETTANTIGGVRAYDGVACQDLMKDWAVISLAEKGEDGEETPNG